MRNYKTSDMMTPEQHQQFKPNENGGCEHWQCKRPVSYICTYPRGSKDEPKFDGVAFACSIHNKEY